MYEVINREVIPLLNEKELEKLRLKMNSKEKTEERNKVIEESLKNIEAEVNEALEGIEMPSEAELQARMKALLFDASKLDEQTPAKTEEAPAKEIKSIMTRKKIGKTLMLAAVISLLGLSFIITTVASKHNISIENGFVAYVKDAIVITFFGDSEEKYISVDVLKTDLENNGFENVIIPKYFENGNWKVSIPEPTDTELTKQVSLKIYNDESSFSFIIGPHETQNRESYFSKLENAETIRTDETYIYLFEHNNGNDTSMYYCISDYDIRIQSKTNIGTMREIAKTIE